MRMTSSIITLLVVGAARGLGAQGKPNETAWQPSPGHTQLPIWPSTVPAGRPGPNAETVAAADSPVAGRPWLYVRNVSVPTLTV